MTSHPAPTAVRRAARLLALGPAILVTSLTSPAFAEAPSTWENPPHVSAAHVILVLVLIPVALFALIALLVYVPSMKKGESYHPGQPWRSEPEWFGGPKGGVEDADRAHQPAAVGAGPTDDDAGRGGTSARW
ncbi:hypothetical protein BH10ACT10_BH10ACT10_27560 [soil metagenome]